MNKIGELHSLQSANVLQTILSQGGVDSFIEATGHTFVVTTADLDANRAESALKKFNQPSGTSRPIPFWISFASSLGFFLIGLFLLGILGTAVNKYVALAVVSFAGALIIVNLPVDVRKKNKQAQRAIS